MQNDNQMLFFQNQPVLSIVKDFVTREVERMKMLLRSSIGNPDYGPQKPQKLKVLKTIDFKHFLENKSSKTVFCHEAKFTNLYGVMSTLQPAFNV